MGIPSYFSYIIKNFANIIRTLDYFHQNKAFCFDHLFMDCNSIIYDSVRIVLATEKYRCAKQTEECRLAFEDDLIGIVIESIEQYIYTIQPRQSIYIAFDGIAPFAKMEQQRSRRQKVQMTKELTQTILSLGGLDTTIDNGDETAAFSWDTFAITAGTEFMMKLAERIDAAFVGKAAKYNVRDMFVSTSMEDGEGEHKIFAHCRNHCNQRDTIALYGLDADLLMLAMVHCSVCPNIYVFREAPEFQSVLSVDDTSSKKLYFVDIARLIQGILKELQTTSISSVYDYVLMCFILGNDFMPSSPCINIRTAGIQVLLDMYRTMRPRLTLIDPATNTIQWNQVNRLFKKLASCEHTLLMNEHTRRAKMSEQWIRKMAHNKLQTKEQVDEWMIHYPILHRPVEEYIAPHIEGWQERYYKALFPNTEPKEEQISNYREGIEWTYRYYTGRLENSDEWYSKNGYAPLYQDIVKYSTNERKKSSKKEIPKYEIQTEEGRRQYISEMRVQEIKEKLQMAYKRYLWECH
jgi:5'-3' exonuclease